MATENLEYLDESGLNRTAGNVLAKIAESKAQIEEELNSLSYARPDGIYPEMTVGAVIGADETAQWSQRTTEGSGAATVRSVQGAAVGWNQLTEPSKFANNASALSTVENVTTVTSTNQNGYFFGVRLRTTADMISGHKYLVAYDVDRSGCVDTDFKGIDVSGFTPSMSALNSGHYWRIGTSTGSNVYVNAVYLNTNPHDLTGEYFTLANVMLIDLTAMFGSGNEPSTVAEFEAMYPAAYYPYSAPTLKPVQIAGIASTDAQGDELDAIEWTAQTLWGAGAIGDMLYTDHKETKIGLIDLGTLNWNAAVTSVEGSYRMRSEVIPTIINIPSSGLLANIRCVNYDTITGSAVYTNNKGISLSAGKQIAVFDPDYNQADSPAAFKAAMSGVVCAYELATPTTTPISPALPMTYKVQQGGSESIIVPDGEVSAAPVLTVAEPVNMSTELAQIWAAIETLQGSRQALQSDVRNNVQEITADLTPIDVTKEVQQTDENREVSE